SASRKARTEGRVRHAVSTAGQSRRAASWPAKYRARRRAIAPVFATHWTAKATAAMVNSAANAKWEPGEAELGAANHMHISAMADGRTTAVWRSALTPKWRYRMRANGPAMPTPAHSRQRTETSPKRPSRARTTGGANRA